MPSLLSYVSGSAEPVSVFEAREACRAVPELDIEIGVSLQAAREQAEQITSRFYRRQVQREVLADWPIERYLVLDLHEPGAVKIEYRSAVSPDTWTELPADQYRWAASGHQTRIALRAVVAGWPLLAGSEEWPDRVRIDVTVGPASAAMVPAVVRRYMLAHTAAWLEQPAAQRSGSGDIKANPLFDHLLDGERLWS